MYVKGNETKTSVLLILNILFIFLDEQQFIASLAVVPVARYVR